MQGMGTGAVPCCCHLKPKSENSRFFLQWKIKLFGIFPDADLNNLLLFYILLSIFSLLHTSFCELSHVPYGNSVYLFSNKEHF